tara:strand:- start:1868 stop:2332 length:465 start_codon:yes stop_codon:yes gene_type:complete
MLKKTLILIIFILIASCGYEPILSEKNINNYNFSLSGLSFEGDKVTNLKIKEQLNIYKLNRTNKNFTLRIKSVSEKKILAKNLKGDPTNFKNTTILYVDILDKNNIEDRLKFEASFNYNNDKNKFNLKRYEKEIKKNLAETVTNKLIIKLSSIQ